MKKSTKFYIKKSKPLLKNSNRNVIILKNMRKKGNNIMSNVDNLMNIMFLVVGAYTIYSAILMMTKGEISKWLLGEKTDLKKCRDVQGFINYLGMKVLIFGIVIVLFSVVGFINTFVVKIGKYYLLGMTAVLLVALVAFTIMYLKARKKFLD